MKSLSPLVVADKLSLHTAGVKRFSQISLALYVNECVALVGPSGIGKSSFAKLLLGLAEGEISGELELFGQRITSLKQSEFKSWRGIKVALLPQGLGDALNPHMTVLEHMEELLSPPQQSAEKALLPANVPEILHSRYPYQLSGGEVQRILLALALAKQPDIVILDEPTAALDNVNKAALLDYLNQLKSSYTFLLISHDEQTVSQLADRVINFSGNDDISLPQPTFEPIAAQVKHKCLLSVKHLSYRDLFDHFSLQLFANDLLVIQGASGCGKTTLARVLAGFIIPEQGLIKRSRQLNNSYSVSLISQHPYLACAPHFTVRQLLEEPLKLTKKYHNSRQIHDWLTAVNLPSTTAFLARQVSQLSGGELQRVVIARALSVSPAILIADEPTSALDRHSCKIILTLLKRLQADLGFTLVIFSHDEQVAQFMGVEPKLLRPEGLVTQANN